MQKGMLVASYYSFAAKVAPDYRLQICCNKDLP